MRIKENRLYLKKDYNTMKKYSISVIILSVVTLFLSCGSIPISEAPPKNNRTYNVSYLFEHEGIKVYRFYDNGEYVYFTNCGGEVTSISNDSAKVKIQTIR